MNDSKLIRDIEDRLKALNLEPEEETKRRRAMYRALGVEESGYMSKDLELPEDAVLLGVCKGDVKQAIARGGFLWVDGEKFSALSTAAAKATGRPTQSGWEFWVMVYLPGTGFTGLAPLRLTAPRVNSKRK